MGKATTSLTNLDENEREVVRQCLHAAANGPFFPDWEFGTIFGLKRQDIRNVLSFWPDVDEADESVVRAINNSLNNLLGYPARNKEEEWPKFISASYADVARILDKWKGRSPRNSWRPRDYFEDAM